MAGLPHFDRFGDVVEDLVEPDAKHYFHCVSSKYWRRLGVGRSRKSIRRTEARSAQTRQHQRRPNLAEETNELEEAVATTSSLLEKEEEHRQMQRADHFAEAADPLAGLPPSTKEINILRVRAREKPPPKPVSPAEMTGEINKLLGLNNEVPQGMDPGTAKEPETVLQLLVRASKRDNARDAAGKYVPNQAVAEALYKKNEIADRRRNQRRNKRSNQRNEAGGRFRGVEGRVHYNTQRTATSRTTCDFCVIGTIGFGRAVIPIVRQQ
eukprot:g8821.t1